MVSKTKLQQILIMSIKRKFQTETGQFKLENILTFGAI